MMLYWDTLNFRHVFQVIIHYKWDIGLGVAPAAQGQGVGGQLLAWLQELARQEKMHKITLRVLGEKP